MNSLLGAPLRAFGGAGADFARFDLSDAVPEPAAAFFFFGAAALGAPAGAGTGAVAVTPAGMGAPAVAGAPPPAGDALQTSAITHRAHESIIRSKGNGIGIGEKRILPHACGWMEEAATDRAHKSRQTGAGEHTLIGRACGEWVR